MSDAGQSFQGTIEFDTSSGISLEEQQGILQSIDAMAVGSRIVPEAETIKASKKDFHFPLLVNIGAVVLLGLGSLLLSLFHDHDELLIRESSSFLGITERRLIQEIRKETAGLLNEKEKQINDILARSTAVDQEYRLLLGSLESLSEAQRERVAFLAAMQEEYRSTLSNLEDEKARILEDSRLREAFLRAQAEARVKDLSSQLEHGETSLSAAMEELRKLDVQQQSINRIESQMGGFYRTLDNQIAGGRVSEVPGTLNAMKDFLNTPSFQGIQVLETRRLVHLAAISVMERAVSIDGGTVQSEGGEAYGEISGEKSGEISLEELKARNAALSAMEELETSYAEQKQALNQRDSEILVLREEIIQKEDQLSSLNSELSSLQTQYYELQRRTEAALRAFTEENPE